MTASNLHGLPSWFELQDSMWVRVTAQHVRLDQISSACHHKLLCKRAAVKVAAAVAVYVQGGFNDFKAAPGGAATWLYVLSGRQVVVLLPPTAANRCASCQDCRTSLALGRRLGAKSWLDLHCCLMHLDTLPGTSSTNRDQTNARCCLMAALLCRPLYMSCAQASLSQTLQY